jgi:RNA recognition motif-containing protein
MTKDQLSDLFGKYGELLSCYMKTNKDGSNTGIGYVNFAKTESAQKAMAALNKFELSPGNCILVTKFVSRQENNLQKDGLTPIAQNMKKTYDNNIFVNKIPLEVTDAQVLEVFSQTGKILQHRLIKKPNKNF